MPFSGPYSIFSALANWGAQQAPKVWNWWDDDSQPWTQQAPDSFPDTWRKARIKNWDDQENVRNQLDILDSRPYPEPTGVNPHQRMPRAQLPMFTYNKQRNPIPDYEDWGW